MTGAHGYFFALKSRTANGIDSARTARTTRPTALAVRALTVFVSTSLPAARTRARLFSRFEHENF